MTWDEAFAILRPLATDDYVGGAWPTIRYEKCKALFELAGQVKNGCIVELGTFRGLGAIALALGAREGVRVMTVDQYESHNDALGRKYDGSDKMVAIENYDRAGLSDKIKGWVREVRDLGEHWAESIGLLFWDLGERDRAMDDIRAWLPHVVEGGVVVLKDLEDGSFGGARLAELGLEPEEGYPEGCMVVARKANHAIWIVDGKRYEDEAMQSARSVARAMPGLNLHIYSPEGRKHQEWFVEQTRLLLTALTDLPDGAKMLWLDSDTYVLEPVPELFEMLNRFDMCLAHAPGHHTAPTVNPIPDSFPEFNIGAIAAQNNPAVRELWINIYSTQQYNASKYGNNDQAALREQIWQGWRGRFAVLPPEYDCRFNFGCQVRDRVKILHGRFPTTHCDACTAERYERVGSSINAGYAPGDQVPPRIWRPDVRR